MRPTGLLAAAILWATVAGAQTPAYQWHTFYNKGAAGWEGGVGRAAATDLAGNVYVVGETSKPQSFAPGHLPLHVVPDNARSAFVLKLNPQGEYVWHTLYTAFQGAGANGVAVDSDGSVYVTGGNEITGDGSQPAVNPATGQQSLFVLKLDSNGLFKWHTHYGAAEAGMAVAVDRTRHRIYVTGARHCCTGWTTQLPPLRAHTYGTNDIFVIALDPSGMELWTTNWGVGAGLGRAIAVDGAGNIYVGGQQAPGSTVFKLYGPDAPQGYGQLAWLREWGSLSVYGLAVDAAGNVYATGQAFPFNGPTGQAPLASYVSLNGVAGYVLKMDTDGFYQWHTRWGTSIDGVGLDGQGNVYAAGNDPFTDTFNGAAPLRGNGGQGGHFLLALQTSGAYKWHTVYGAWQYSAAHALALDGAKAAYLAGGSGVQWYGDNGALGLELQLGGDSAWVQKFALRQTPVITWANPANITFGTALGAGQLNATANVAGTFTYSPAAGTVLPVGNGQALSATFTPTDTSAYATATGSVMINVLAAPPRTPARLVVTKTMTRNAGQVAVVVTIANTGGTAAENVRLTTGKINTTSGTPLPQTAGTVAAGGSASVTLSFPGAVGNAGAAATLSLGGTYTGGTFSSASRIVLP